MKKGITKILSACVFAFVVFLVAGTQSKAATNMGLKQTNAGSGSVDLEWNAQLGADHYHVQFSQDGKTWTILHHRMNTFIICLLIQIIMHASLLTKVLIIREVMR